MKYGETATASAPTAARLDMAAQLARMVGLAACVCMACCAIGAAAAIWQRTWAALPVGLAVGLAAGGLALLALAWRDVLAALELATGRDIDGDGAIGDTPILLRANTAGETPAREDFPTFVRGCQTDTSARRWEPVLGRERYREWRDLLIDGSWARWRSADQRAGWELTAEPDAILAALD